MIKLSTKKMPSGQHFVFLGQVKIAEIFLLPGLTQWKVELRYGDNENNTRLYENTIKAIGDLWHILELPPPEGADFVKLSKYKVEKENYAMLAVLNTKPQPKPKKKKVETKKAATDIGTPVE